jgi:hypothetical protein
MIGAPLNHIMFVLLALFTTIVGNCQPPNNSAKKELWTQQLYGGISAGYPTLPFINLGVSINQQFYFDAFVEPDYSKVHMNYYNLGYQLNNLWNQKLHTQMGLSLMQVPDKTEINRINTYGVNLKLIKPFSKWFAVYISGCLSYPDSRVTFSKQINLNIGVNFYITDGPNLTFWME